MVWNSIRSIFLFALRCTPGSRHAKAERLPMTTLRQGQRGCSEAHLCFASSATRQPGELDKLSLRFLQHLQTMSCDCIRSAECTLPCLFLLHNDRIGVSVRLQAVGTCSHILAADCVYYPTNQSRPVEARQYSSGMRVGEAGQCMFTELMRSSSSGTADARSAVRCNIRLLSPSPRDQ